MDQTRECSLQTSSVSGRHPESCDGALWDLKKYSIGHGVRTNEEIPDYIKENMMASFHLSCTCKMGANADSMTVVDNQESYLGQLSCGLLSQCVSDSVSGASTGYSLQLAFVLQMMS
jgi:hypothetical protein